MEYLSLDPMEISHVGNYAMWDLIEILLPLFSKHYTDDSLRETIRSANHIWCAYEYSQCLGCALMTDVGSNGGLYMILFGIRQSAQGRGIGKNLLENMINWARQRNYRFIYLHTESDNHRAIGMYERAGFHREHYQNDQADELPKFGNDVVPMILFLR